MYEPLETSVMGDRSNWDIDHFIELHNNKRLNLSPSYQRKSVWTTRDRQYFLDTIFRKYPSPPIYVHKESSGTGVASYAVVDGKQRISTIIDFAESKLKLSNDFQDERLDGKTFKQLDDDMKRVFWNHSLMIETIKVVEPTIVNEIFARLNKNVVKLKRQELRHAQFNGWFISFVEGEVEKSETAKIWTKLGVVTPGRSRRMDDVQFISELLLVVLDQHISGFSQDYLDESYALYDDTSAISAGVDIDWAVSEFEEIRTLLARMENEHQAISKSGARNVRDLYSLWSVLALNRKELPRINVLSQRYIKALQIVGALRKGEDNQLIPKDIRDDIQKYIANASGAVTEFQQRQERYVALRSMLLK